MDNVFSLLLEQLAESIDEFITVFLNMQDNDDHILGEAAHILRLLVDEESALQIIFRPTNFARVLNYYEKVILRYNDDDHHSYFRMTQNTFKRLAQVIRLHTLPMQNTPEQNVEREENEAQTEEEEEDMPLEKKIYITIWILATSDSFRSVADRFGVSPSTAYDAYKEIPIILCQLMPRYIRWPNNKELANIENIFHRRSGGFPGVVGAIDGCYIQIKQPPGNANDYYNQKNTHSIILQGTCEYVGKFIGVVIGAPGRAHDARILRNSSLYRKLTDEQIPLLPPDKHLLGIQVIHYMLVC